MPKPAQAVTKKKVRKKRFRKQVTAAIKKRRREFVDDYKRQHGITLAHLAHRFGMSVSAIMGIIREDRSRYSDDKRDRFLKRLGVTEGQWYGK